MFDNNFQDQNAQQGAGLPNPVPTPGPFDPVGVGSTPNPGFEPMIDPNMPAPAPAAPAPAPQPVSDGGNDLLSIKQQALQQLSPLVGQLEQTPEEKFRTTMMMIQASDDQSMIQAAYDAAKQITDEKVRAQALLDVVNEINYFTQQNHQQ